MPCFGHSTHALVYLNFSYNFHNLAIHCHTSGSFCDDMCSDVFPVCDREAKDTSTSTQGRASTVQLVSCKATPFAHVRKGLVKMY